jgi:hypothetical protein
VTAVKIIAPVALLVAACALPVYAQEGDAQSLPERLNAARLEAYRTAQLPAEAVKPAVESVDCFYAENASHPACER